MRHHLLLGLALITLPLSACQLGGELSGYPTAGGDDEPINPGPDAAPPVLPLSLEGSVRDFESGVALASAGMATVGLPAPLETTSRGDGTFDLAPIDIGSSFSIKVSPAANYRPTIGALIETAGQPSGATVTLDQIAVAIVYVQRQHNAAGRPIEPNTAFLVAELQNPQGLPAEGVPAEALTLTDAAQAPVGVGPYFIGPNGDIDPALTASVAVNGHARAVFLNVPPGSFTLTVTGGAPVPVGTEAGGATLALARTP